MNNIQKSITKDPNIIKVLQIVDNLSISSGVSSMIMNLFRGIDKTLIGFDFLVATKVDKSYEKEIESLGGKVFYFGNPLSFKKTFNSIKELKLFFQNHGKEYDIAHLHTPTISEFVLHYAKRCGIRHIIAHSHSSKSSTSFVKSVINRLLTLRIKSLANHYWACSSVAGEYLFGKNTLTNGKLTIINNAIDPNGFSFDLEKRKRLRDEMNISDRFVIAHIARFDKNKNHAFIIDVINRLKESKSPILFLFVGDGPEKDHIVAMAKKKKLDDMCVFLGRRNDVSDLLQASDLLVLPSIKEGLPVTVVEAQAVGLPCLISDSITREVNIGNVMFSELDSNKWSNLICQLNILSDDERKARSESFNLSKFNIFHESRRVEQLYLKMVERDEK